MTERERQGLAQGGSPIGAGGEGRGNLRFGLRAEAVGRQDKTQRQVEVVTQRGVEPPQTDVLEALHLDVAGIDGQVHPEPQARPLWYDDDTIEKVIFCAEKGIPQVLFPGLQAGATSPATFAGTIVQGSAESLCGLVVAQLVRTGAPVIYGAFATIMDMATAIFSYGAPEMNLMTAAMAQMAQHYNLPFFGTAGCSDAKFHDDPQAVIEATFSCLSSALSGANLVHDLGLLDHSAVISPNYLVLVDEILSMVNQYMRGILVNDETLALDLIDRVGPSGHYLEEEHTMRHFRDVWYSDLFDRKNYDEWLKQGSMHFTERLREKTRKLMDLNTEPLPTEIIKEMDRMAKHWHRDSGH